MITLYSVVHLLFCADLFFKNLSNLWLSLTYKIISKVKILKNLSLSAWERVADELNLKPKGGLHVGVFLYL